MAPAAAAMAFQLLMAYPLNLYPGRDTLDQGASYDAAKKKA